MKKIYKQKQQRRYNAKKSRKGLLKRRRRFTPVYTSYKDSIRSIKNSVIAPTDFRLIKNLQGALPFFRQIRSRDNLSNVRGNKFVQMSLTDVEDIDYGSVSIMTAISDDVLYKNIIFHTRLPKKESCKNFLADSGFLNHMYDMHGNKISVKANSDLLFFEKGSGKLSEKDNKKISELVKRAVEHLTGQSKHCLPIKTLILEICGNSIEWGNTSKKQWLFGLKYDKDKVIFTVTDVGMGILKTLKRKFGQTLSDLFSAKDSKEILLGAFEKKYNSSSMEINRNKGLPSVRINFELGRIKNLKIITNDVILHYDDPTKSRILTKEECFDGTFYQWEMDIDCINIIYNKK